MVNSYIATDDIAPQIIFYNGPAANSYTSSRYSFYGVSATPTFKIDGLYQVVGWNQSSCQNLINTRVATPSYVDIYVDVLGNASGGTAYYAVTAEQDLGVSGQIKLWSAILESHDIATSAYGVYNGQELMWEPRAFPLGAQGTVISFTGPYPQTVYVQGTYTLNPTQWTFSNLDIITYLQVSAGNREVLNASFEDLPDTSTGVEGASGAEVGGVALAVWPNPSSGILSASSTVPGGTASMVRIFDISGRIVAEFEGGGVHAFSLDEPGVYFARLETSSGEVSSTRFSVVR